MYAEAIKPLAADLVLVGVQAHDELDGVLPPLPGRGPGAALRGRDPRREGRREPGTVTACKEFPGAVMARMKVKLPAVLGILGAEQPPRYVPVSRIRAAMKTTQFEEQAVAAPGSASRWSRSAGSIRRRPASRAEMLTGSEAEVAARIAEILAEKGLVK